MSKLVVEGINRVEVKGFMESIPYHREPTIDDINKWCVDNGYKTPTQDTTLPQTVAEKPEKVTLTVPHGQAYPTKLTDYLYEQGMDRSEIFTSPITDGTLWMIVPKGCDKWVTLVSWYDGEKDFDLINLNERGLDRLLKILNEVTDYGNN